MEPEDETGFSDKLSASVVQLIPLLPLTGSAASLHWLLRMAAYYPSSPALREGTAGACIKLLLKISVLLKEKTSNDGSPSLALTQLLQTE